MTQGNYANVDGLKMYYEMHGAGKPLVLLHGGLGSIAMFAQLLPALAESRQVIAVDLQGHGHTADMDRPFSYERMADNIAALIQQLKLPNADLVGYSLGGGVALHTAIRHPEVVRRLVLVSTPFKSEGWFPESRAGMKALNAQAAQAMVGSPPHQAYVNSAPQPENWTTLVTKTGQLVGQDYDWSAGVSRLALPTMIVVGDADAVRPTHAVQFFELVGGGQRDAGWDGSGMPNSRLAVLPATTHYNIIDSPLLAPIITAFLDAPMPQDK